MPLGSRIWKLCAALVASVAFTAAAHAQSVRIACPTAIPIYYLPLSIADSLGLFEKQGLQVEIVDLVGANAANALLSNSVDLSCNSLDHAIKVFGKGPTLKMVAAFQSIPGMALIVSSDLEGQVQSVSDLRERAIGIGVTGSSTHLGLQYVLRQNGLSEQDVRVVSVPGAPFVAAMQAGQIEAGMNLEPFISRLLRDGTTYVLVDLRTREGTEELFGVDEFIHTGILAREVTIEENPELIQKVVDALVEASNWIHANGAEQIADQFPDLGELRTDFISAMETFRVSFYENGVPTETGFETTLDFHKTLGTVEADVAVEMSDVIDLRFIQN